LYRYGCFNGSLLCAGAEGNALPHSRVMIHQPSGGAQGVATDMEINLREMLKLKDELYNIISHSGQTFDRCTKTQNVITG
jgi:ATP-dependent Clp protease protease subunit